MNQPVRITFTVWVRLFWIFLKVNLLTTAGPTSVGLLYKETVGTILTEAQFVEAVGFSNLVPGSEALKLAMFIGYASGGAAGMFAALLGAIIPPTIIMLTVASILIRFQAQDWMKNMVRTSPSFWTALLRPVANSRMTTSPATCGKSPRILS